MAFPLKTRIRDVKVCIEARTGTPWAEQSLTTLDGESLSDDATLDNYLDMVLYELEHLNTITLVCEKAEEGAPAEDAAPEGSVKDEVQAYGFHVQEQETSAFGMEEVVEDRAT